MLSKMTGIHRVPKALATGVKRFYYYTRRGGKCFWVCDGRPEREPMPKAMREAYDAALLEERDEFVIRHSSGKTVNWWIDEFIETEQSNMKEITWRGYEAYIPLIREEFGKDDLAVFEKKKMRRDVKKWHRRMKDKPRFADAALGTLVRILNVAVDEGELAHHCAARIKRLHKANRAAIIWEYDEIELACAQTANEHGELAIRFAELSGLRRADLVRITRNADRGDHLRWTTQKKGVEVLVPIVPELRDVLNRLDALRKKLDVEPVTILFSSHGSPWTESGLDSLINRAKGKAGIKGKTLHDMRGTAATHWIRYGSLDEDVAEILGWSAEDVKAIRRKYVDVHENMARSIRAAKKNANRTKPVNRGVNHAGRPTEKRG